MTGVQIADSLPPSSDALAGDDLDFRARAVLRLLIDRMEGLPQGSPVARNADLCPNCDQPVTSISTPYCSGCCRERAAFIRQMREGLASGSLLDPHRQTMKGEAMWRLLGGGVPRRVALVPEKARERVFKTAEGKCQVCGAPATRIDNTGSG